MGYALFRQPLSVDAGMQTCENAGMRGCRLAGMRACGMQACIHWFAIRRPELQIFRGC